MALFKMLFVTGLICTAFILGTKHEVGTLKPTINSAVKAGAAIMATPTPKPSASPTPEPTKKPVTNLPTEPQTHVVTAVGALAEDKPQVSNNPSPTPEMVNPHTGEPPKVGDIGVDGNGNPDPSVVIAP